MLVRPYIADKDRSAVRRIWTEIGWLQPGQEEAQEAMLAAGESWVAEVQGEAECLVTTAPGTLRYLHEDLPFALIATVTTSRLARKQGLAGRVTARAVASLAGRGALVAGLGIFDQGYYDQLGFGVLGYEHFVALDPARLKIPIQPRVPRRLSAADLPAIHASRLRRRLGHGACSGFPAAHTQSALLSGQNGFGLGYFDGPAGELTHHLWARAENVVCGPYRIAWLAYQNRQQFLELMALLQGWNDQVFQIILTEPPDVQLQDLIRQPLRQRRMSDKSSFEMSIHANAIYQMRICDLAGCLAHTHLRGESIHFNLALSDPIERYLDANAPWRGVAGRYVVTLGTSSEARPGCDSQLPTLEATVSAFTRLWLGARPATSLAMTDALVGPDNLLEQLDQILCLPTPKPNWNL